ncbi:MAG: DUF547 domain-containing protein [Elusimicrobia bacterium]|nr:DUF547 domain-containing protein [Elusimicrobiota bacterium]
MDKKWFVAMGVFLTAAAPAFAAFDQGHALYARVLQRFVKDARVDYAALKADPKDLDQYLDQLAAVPEGEFQTWTKDQRLAYLLNLYNAQTLRLIIDHYPLKSIKDIGNFLKGPWDQPVVRLFGKTITLADLEHKIIRKQYGEPRVHFAMVCAAKGCPPLRNEPFVADRLSAQLDEQGRTFMADTKKNRMDVADNVLRLSPIFDWFKVDFIGKAGSVQAFVAPFFPKESFRKMLSDDYKIQYTDYDWSLNEPGK